MSRMDNGDYLLILLMSLWRVRICFGFTRIIHSSFHIKGKDWNFRMLTALQHLFGKLRFMITLGILVAAAADVPLVVRDNGWRQDAIPAAWFCFNPSGKVLCSGGISWIRQQSTTVNPFYLALLRRKS